MAYALRSTMDKWDLIKLHSFCKAKDTVDRPKLQPAYWERSISTFYQIVGNDTNIAKKHLKKISTSLVIRKCKSKHPEIPPHTSQKGQDQKLR